MVGILAILLPLLLQLFEFIYTRNHPAPLPTPTPTPVPPIGIFGLRGVGLLSTFQKNHLALAVSRMKKIVALTETDEAMVAAISEADAGDDQVAAIMDKYK